MPAFDSYQEWQRLNELYSEKGDEELLELRLAYEDLTEVAQSVLRDELRRRKLWDSHEPPSTASEDSSPPAGLDGDRMWEIWNDLQAGGVSVCECETLREADLCRYVLELANIESAVLNGDQGFSRRPGFYMHMPQVRVAPHDAERAKALLAQPIPAEVVKSFEAERTHEDFKAPVCKRCASTDILLEAVEPTNQWLCDRCGARWQDPPLEE